jgi:4-alpha-glucanotransferase
MNYKRSGGILLHPTSLPGPDGIGDLGPEAYRWIDFLSECGCGLWQVLPLNPTGYGDSPYQSFSAFAGNPYLISPVLLREEGLLTRADLSDRPAFPDDVVDYGEVINWKLKVLALAYRHYKSVPNSKLTEDLAAFRQQQSFWLEDYALFMAIKAIHGGVSWIDWQEPYRHREPDVLKTIAKDHADEIEQHIFNQFIFFRQWQDVRDYAHEKGIQIIGDAPIFVSFDSADTWSHPELFYLDEDLKPTVVAGVPPDYFSATGQLWGNPLYKWSAHAREGFKWWIERIRAALQTVDVIRLDHFRGFSGYWEIPYGKPTAEIGRWVKGPGEKIFMAIDKALGELPIIAEDLGVITQDVTDLRNQFKLPGMRIFQFAFADGPSDRFLPHNYDRNTVAYTGTHDNDTSLGWYRSTAESERDFIRRYLGVSGQDISWDMIRAVWQSVADFAVAPMQDFLSLGTEARMNYPGRPAGNWTWRMRSEHMNQFLALRIKDFNYMYSRMEVEDAAAQVVTYAEP